MPGGQLNFFEPGSTSTRKDTFSDQPGATANTNPVILDDQGVVPDIFLDGTYSVTLTDQGGVLVASADPIGGDVTGGSFADWNQTISYSEGVLVTADDGCRYQSITNDNLNNDPTLEGNPTEWEKVIFVRIWNINVTYDIRALVQASDGNLYRSIAGSNTGNDPTSSATWTAAVDITGTDLALTQAFASAL